MSTWWQKHAVSLVWRSPVWTLRCVIVLGNLD